MIFADDLVLIGENNMEDVSNILNDWRIALEEKGLRIGRNKTEYMEYEFGGKYQEVDGVRTSMAVGGDTIKKVEYFKYLGSVVPKDGDFGMDLKHRMKCGWMKWRDVSGVLCDKRISTKLKDKLYRSVVIPAMLYGLECWTADRRIEQTRVVMKMNVDGKRGRGRPQKRWLENMERDMRAVGVCIGDVKDRYKWRFRTRVADPKVF
ncbi:hypothetical protein QTP88_010404 [Uroleucon formosanum]